MTREERAKYLNQLIIPDLFDNSQEACELRMKQETALRETIAELMQEPCEVTEYDKDHIWYKGSQYISLRRFLEVKAEIEDKVSRIIDDHPLDGYEDGQLILKTIRDVQPVTPKRGLRLKGGIIDG